MYFDLQEICLPVDGYSWFAMLIWKSPSTLQHPEDVVHLNPFAASLEKMKIEAILAPSLGQNPTPKKLQKHVIIYIYVVLEKKGLGPILKYL